MKEKILKISPDLVPLILSGEKTTTWRLFDDKDLKAGDIVMLIKRPELVPFAKTELIDVKETRFSELSRKDLEGHERYSSEKEMYKTYSGYYNRPVDGNTEVKIIKFKIMEML